MSIRIPKEYCTVLQTIHDIGYSNAVIGGGCIRDLYCNKQINDVDIFLPLKPTATPTVFFDSPSPTNINKISTTFNVDTSRGDVLEYVTKNKTYAYKRLHIKHVWNLCLNHTKFQLIVVNLEPKTYVMEYFDFGICMCYYDGKNTHYGTNFFRDVNNKTITLCGRLTGNEIVYSLSKHLTKLKKKFPGYELGIDPKNIIDENNKG